MISVTKEETETIRKQIPEAHIVRTERQKSKRHRYYCEETPDVMRLLRRLRGIDAPRKERGRGAGNADRTRTRRDKI